jgi:hypothetical protein
MIDASMHGQNNKVIIPSHAFVVCVQLRKLIAANISVFSYHPN